MEPPQDHQQEPIFSSQSPNSQAGRPPFSKRSSDPRWARRYVSIPASDEPEAQIARLRYLPTPIPPDATEDLVELSAPAGPRGSAREGF